MNNEAAYNDKTYTAWQSTVFKKARRHRMRLAWSVWGIAAVFVLFQFFLQLSSGEIIAGLMHSFALTAFGGGVLASSYYYVYVLLQIPIGILMDQYGPRRVLSISAFFVCVGSFIFCAAKTAVIALIGRVLMGAGSAAAFVGCLSVISIWFPVRRFSFMAAVVETAGMLGAIIGNFWLAHLIQQLGWRACLSVAGFFAGILSFFLIAIIRDTPRKKKITKVAVQNISIYASLKKITVNPIMWINGIYSGLMFGIVTVFIALWAIPFFEYTRHLSLVNATVIASSLYVGVAVGGPIIGWVDGRTLWRRQIMVINAACASLCLFVVIFCASLSLWCVGLFLFLAGVCASSYVLTFAIANDISESNTHAMCIGFTNTLCVIFAPILQPLVGFLMTHLKHTPQGFEWAVSIVPISLLFAVVIGFFLPKKMSVKTQ